MSDIRHVKDNNTLKHNAEGQQFDMFVLDKSIFSNIFDKDIKRVYVYKKAERLAKAIHLVAPAFQNSPALRDRIDRVAVGLVDAAVLAPAAAKDALSRELLALSSVLSIARIGGLLSTMNADLIAREAQLLLQEVAGYEEPRLFLEDAPTLAELTRSSTKLSGAALRHRDQASEMSHTPEVPKGQTNGHVSDKGKKSSRQEAILSVLATKGPSYIKDISLVVREVSEKTIQRELAALVEEGSVERSGERRWTTYALAS
tara:strand:+ start:541551 stop:542324 length:774 start_codon:yes stop_codon:yes gene_type:complete